MNEIEEAYSTITEIRCQNTEFELKYHKCMQFKDCFCFMNNCVKLIKK